MICLMVERGVNETLGTLYICGTPIGNLEDVSIRLLKTLRQADLIACEDTRNTIKLLNRYKIKKKMISYHKFSGPSKEEYLIEQLLAGKRVALVSDAGMPGISDPGEYLVKRAIEAGIHIEVVPGPSALIAALAISGLNTTAFVFAGFLPSRAIKRQQSLQQFLTETRTVILYESPHRLTDTLADITSVLGEERKLVVVRELTKVFEETKRGTAAELKEFFSHHPPRGEICLLIAGAEVNQEPPDLEMIAEEINTMVEAGMDKKEALKIKAREHQIKKAILYKYFVEKKD